MRHFHRRIRLYGVAGQIYKLVGEEPFTLEDLLEAGIDIHQSNLVNLRTRGAVTHPPDTLRIRRRMVWLGRVEYQKNKARRNTGS